MKISDVLNLFDYPSSMDVEIYHKGDIQYHGKVCYMDNDLYEHSLLGIENLNEKVVLTI